MTDPGSTRVMLPKTIDFIFKHNVKIDYMINHLNSIVPEFFLQFYLALNVFIFSIIFSREFHRASSLEPLDPILMEFALNSRTLYISAYKYVHTNLYSNFQQFYSNDSTVSLFSSLSCSLIVLDSLFKTWFALNSRNLPKQQ